MARPKSRKGRLITVDFEGVESGARAIPDGNYLAEITEIKETESKSSGEPMLALKWKVTSKTSKGATVFDNISLQPQALWRLKGLMEALGQEVPDSSMEIDLEELEGQSACIEITNEVYEGKDRPRVTAHANETDFRGKAGDSDNDEEDEAPKASKKSGKKALPPDVEDETDDEDEDEEEEDERVNRQSKKSPEFKVGQKVKFKDEDGKTVRGVILEIDGDTVKVEDKDDDEWEIDISELQSTV